MKKNGLNNSFRHKFSMSQREFEKFSNFVYAECGVKLPPAKRTMLTSRLTKRLRVLGMTSFQRYFDYVSSPKGRSEELVQMIDVVTTNKTDFFREPKHFDFLLKNSLPDLVKSGRMGPGRRLKVWSAGCSSGEEPYTLAMVLSEFFERRQDGDFTVLGTDISTRVLATAKSAIYPERLAAPIPLISKRKYLMRGNGSQKGYCRIAPELRSRVHFKRLNLIQGRNFGIKTLMDVIFCRNVIIYFDRETQRRLFEKFYTQLTPGGYLFIGHSETLHGINEQFVPLAVSVYRKPV